MPLMFEQEHPEDLVVRRVMCIVRHSVASAIAIAASVTATVVAAIIAVVVMPLVARGAVNHRRRAVNDGWRAVRDRRRVTDRSRKREVHRPARLRRGGEAGYGNHSNQTEQCFCFHERFDGRLRELFS